MSPKARACPADSKRDVTLAPASRSIAASRSAFSTRHDRIVFAGRKQYTRVRQVRQARRHERNHRAKQDCAGQHFRPEEENCCGNVRAIGITNGGDALRIEFISRGSSAHKIGQFIRAMNDVFFIEDAFSQPPEKSRHAVLEDLPARTQQRRGGIEVASEGDHIVFIRRPFHAGARGSAAADSLARQQSDA